MLVSPAPKNFPLSFRLPLKFSRSTFPLRGFRKNLPRFMRPRLRGGFREHRCGKVLILPRWSGNFPAFCRWWRLWRRLRWLRTRASWQRSPPSETAELLATYWEKGGRFEPALDEPGSFCARAFLEPFSESLARSSALPPPVVMRGSCPLCDGFPQLGILRPEGDGARRSLLCSFCCAEWDYRRILCPSCGEEDEKKLCVYAAKEFDYLRVEACDSCRSYIITIDLSKNGRAVPLVDELAALPLNLWACGQGYSKLQKNLLGM